MQTEIIKIEGMTCMGCVNSVKNVLEKIPGVASAEVSLERKQVTIQYDARVMLALSPACGSCFSCSSQRSRVA